MKISGCRQFSLLDRCVLEFHKSLATVFGNPQANRPSPAATLPETDLKPSERCESVGLMRVNHAGEISAQALYKAAAITARSTTVRHSMMQSALEENEHLAWCQQRLEELGSHPSYLNPLWYAGSFLIALGAGFASDAINLGFVAETERQVVNHLQHHLSRLPKADAKSRAIIEQMQEDEAHHATVALTAGAIELPDFIKKLMGVLSKVMTRTAYWI